jgi:hypothetical protein
MRHLAHPSLRSPPPMPSAAKAIAEISAVSVVKNNHQDQAGGTAALKQRRGTQVITGFAEIPYLEHGDVLPEGANAAWGGGGYPPGHVDRALYDSDIVQVGPPQCLRLSSLRVTVLRPPVFCTLSEREQEYRVFEFCC